MTSAHVRILFGQNLKDLGTAIFQLKKKSLLPDSSFLYPNSEAYKHVSSECSTISAPTKAVSLSSSNIRKCLGISMKGSVLISNCLILEAW